MNNTLTQASPSLRFRTFLLVWFGQLISLTGSGLTGFALGVWVYQQTKSVTQYALIALFTSLPGIVFSPIIGALVDRWDRRWAMILSDGGSGLSTLSIALLFLAGRLEIWHIYVAMSLISIFSAFQWPAFSAATTLLVPKEQLGRASGMVQLNDATAQIVSPVLAGVLMGVMQVQGIILIDFATYVFAVFTLLISRFPRPEMTAEGKTGQGSLLREAVYGWTYIRARHGLLGLLLFFAGTNFLMGIVQVLFTPLVLSFSTAATLGLILSFGGLGYLAGSLVMSIWGGPRRRMYGILGFTLMSGAVLLMAGLPPRAWILGVTASLFLFTSPIINGCSQAIWQTKTAPDVQGRVFAVRRMIAWVTLPLAYLIAGPLADRVFEPLLSVGGPLAGSVGRIMGVGTGCGIRLLFILLGFMTALATLAAYLYPRLRKVETELPDSIKAA